MKVLTLLALLIAAPTLAAERYTPVVEKTLPSVVKIMTVYGQVVPATKKTPEHVEFVYGIGAGVAISTNGHILTCEHVVSGHPFIIDVTMYGSTTTHHTATVLRRSFDRDLALLKIDTATVAVPLAAEMPRVGDEVLSIGHPFDLEWSVMAGIVSGLRREGLAINLMQIDAQLNPGSSGGPVFNLDGAVVGINESLQSEAAGGIGFAVSVEEIRNFLNIFDGLEQAYQK